MQFANQRKAKQVRLIRTENLSCQDPDCDLCGGRSWTLVYFGTLCFNFQILRIVLQCDSVWHDKAEGDDDHLLCSAVPLPDYNEIVLDSLYRLLNWNRHALVAHGIWWSCPGLFGNAESHRASTQPRGRRTWTMATKVRYWKSLILRTRAECRRTRRWMARRWLKLVITK